MTTEPSSPERQLLPAWIAHWMKRPATLQVQPRAATPLDTLLPSTVLPEHHRLIPESEISDVRIAQTMQAFLLECKMRDSSLVQVRTQAGMNCCVEVVERMRLLHLWVGFKMPESDAERRALWQAAVAGFNNVVALGRAAIDSDGDLVVDTYLSYAGGVLPAQLLHTLAVLERTSAEARSLVS